MPDARILRRIALAAALLLSLSATPPALAEDEEGFESLFNGKDLSGWNYRVKKTHAVTESFDGKAATDDGRFDVEDGALVANPRPEDGKRARLFTAREFSGDFVLKLEFRTSANADSGVFLRKPQLQVRDYPAKGPYYDLRRYKPEDWNELVVTVRGNTARVTCNEEVLEEAMELPASGPIGLESDLGTVAFRNLRVKELP
jgi:hypothetical protein